MDHNELVARGVKWLKNSLSCRVVLSELVASTRSMEIPDVIGWVRGMSILIECKMSRSDFFADLRKPARKNNSKALGHWRFYLTPPRLLNILDIPPGWGLYEVEKQVKYISGVKYTNASQPPFVSNRDSEVAMLVSALSRK